MATKRKAKTAKKMNPTSTEEIIPARRYQRALSTPTIAPVDEEQLYYRILEIFDPDRLVIARRDGSSASSPKAPANQPKPVAKCGTPELASVVEDVVRNYDTLSQDFRLKVEPYIRVHKQNDSYTVEYPAAGK
ncbi:MAG: hypothetical protein A2Z04_00410 [Chloroflexi bacterium RBG_16_57_9]|nr:MAG: hypothetical protein A2Z04_00410 [Chloroflexi bacterium RBG_16_57_9]